MSPPSVDLKTPTPDSESPEAFGSPVPAYSVLPLGSFGSCTSVPNAFEPIPAEENFQAGVVRVERVVGAPDAAAGRADPEPAATLVAGAVDQHRRCAAVRRVVLPVKLSTRLQRGRRADRVPLERPLLRAAVTADLERVERCRAPAICAADTCAAGYARCAACSAAAAANRSPSAPLVPGTARDVAASGSPPFAIAARPAPPRCVVA